VNKDSCDMELVAPAPGASHWDLKEGQYHFTTGADGQRWFNAMFPGQTLCILPIRPLVSQSHNGGHSWQWDGHEDSPTLTPSVHAIDQWHGWVTKGRMVSCN
jgi:hypothetical protein